MNAELAAKNVGVSTTNPLNIKEGIALKGPLPKPYSFAEIAETKRLWRVGLNAHLGRLRYTYYYHRGWIKDEYFVRPDRSALREWLHCLVSPAYARHTWLRLSPEAEARATKALKTILIAIAFGIVFTAGMIIGEYRILNAVQRQTPIPANSEIRITV